jgi:hypothetical protein
VNVALLLNFEIGQTIVVASSLSTAHHDQNNNKEPHKARFSIDLLSTIVSRHRVNFDCFKTIGNIAFS